MKRSLVFAILAALFYVLSSPVSKLLLERMGPTMLAGLLYLGAARTSAYYALAPFMGAFLSFVLLSEMPSMLFFIALGLMVIGTVFVTRDAGKTKDNNQAHR